MNAVGSAVRTVLWTVVRAVAMLIWRVPGAECTHDAPEDSRPNILGHARVRYCPRHPTWLAHSGPYLLLLLVCGCWSSEAGQPQVVVYTALDSEFSEPIFADFAARTNIKPLAKFDTESTKTVGLTEAIIAEAARTRCDVFWNNEILNTLRLQERGLLAVYRSPQAEHYPEAFRSPDGTWHGFAARARVLIVNTKLVKQADWPDSLLDLADDRWRGKVGMAKPLFGTTATHAACLFAHWGPEKARDYFLSLKANDLQIMSGNKQVALAVAAGRLAFGITDTDDAIIELEKGLPVAIIYPDRNDDQMGTLFIPNTLSIIKDCPHPEAAQQLVDYLLAGEVEQKLAAGPSAQIPLRNDLAETALRVETPRTVKAMPVDFAAAAEQWDTAAMFLRDTFTAP